MRQEQEDLARTLACGLWRSAFSPYYRALDNWPAAEGMLAETSRAAREAPESQPDAAVAPVRNLPSSPLPIDYVRHLAQCFWEHSARSAALTPDIWLAAERHVGVLCRQALAGQSVPQPFSAEAYWQRIRDHAEWLWRAQGQPRDRDLDTWLEADAEDTAQRWPLALTMLGEGGMAAVTPRHPSSRPEHGAAPQGL